MEQITIPRREQIGEEYKWRRSRLFATDEEWQAEMGRVPAMLERTASFQDRLDQGWQVMLDCLETQEQLGRTLEKLYLYAAMAKDEDNGNSQAQAAFDQVESLAVQAGQALAFFSPEVLALDPALLDEYLSQPELQLYNRFFHDITRMRRHTLSPAEEKLLAGSAEMAGSFHNIYTLFANADLRLPMLVNDRGEEEQLSLGNYLRFMKSRDRQVRANAYQALHDSFAAWGNTLAALYSSSVKKDNFYAAAQNYSSALAASLYGDNVDESVYHRLIATVRRRLPDFHYYLEQRRQLLGVDKLAMYDLYVPLFPELRQDFTWDEARQLVLAAVAPLGEEYGKVLAGGLGNGWVDVYENRGKTSGAYSSGVYGSDPFILLNYQNDLSGVFTLGHEAGHSMHSWYSRQAQPYIYADYRIFVAEVASTVNENLLTDYLLSRAESKVEMRYLVNHFLEDFRATVIRQTMFAEFELLTHQAAQERQALTAQWLCQTYLRLNREYFGPAVEVDERVGWEWARIPHFYRAFYVYKYATGFCAASALALALLDQDEEKAVAARERYLTFLSAGGSADPLDLLTAAGVDMREAGPIERAFDLFADLSRTIV